MKQQKFEFLNCSLCGSPRPTFFHDDGKRRYFQCSVCDLKFVHPDHLLEPSEERSRYELHENSPEDMGYRTFLSRLFLPLKDRLSEGDEGLDFGCGPGPTLSVMFEEAGYNMSLFDPFFANDPSVLVRQYDFVCSTEVLEHLHHPGETLDRLWGCLKTGGWLGIMTKLARSREDFARWHYIQDPTHVSFYSEATFHWLADKWGAELEIIGSDVIVLQKGI